MDPGIWSTLPEELVQLIFARLPLAHIFRLRVLSKEWNWNVTARESEFRQACSATQSKIFGIVAEGDPCGSFILRFYDIKAHQWHTLYNNTKEYRHQEESPFYTMGATDGGLVCFIERLKNKEKNPFSIQGNGTIFQLCLEMKTSSLRQCVSSDGTLVPIANLFATGDACSFELLA